MKALILKEYKHFAFEDTDPPKIKDDEVLVRVKSCSICGSDVHGMDGSTGRRIPPIIMGHEAAGVIEEAGPLASPYKPGDRVTFDSTIYCGKCWYCKHGLINLCDNRMVLGVSCPDYRLNGAFAEYVAIPSRILYPLPDAVSFDLGAMVEPLSVAYHAVNRSQITLNDTAVVVGAGMIGLLIIQLLKLSSCGRIIAVDLVREKLDMAARFGADACLKSDEVDVAREVSRITNGRGADLAFEVVGITPTLQAAIASLRKGGSLTLVGNLKASVEFPLQAVVTRQITLNGSCASAGEYPDCLDLIARKKVDVEAFISAVAPLSEGASWFDRLYKAEPGLMKVILRP
jgi:L-iditol 2-dehydrogenase